MPPLLFDPRDLASGDQRSASLEPGSFEFHRIRSMDDPLFQKAYAALWAEFGAKHEMELHTTLDQRFQCPEFRYEMILVQRGGSFRGVRDHTAIALPGGHGAVVHLSHNLVAPEARRTGLAGWLRALPIQTARELVGADAAITLVGEMEYEGDGSIRLLAYEKAGFQKIDPARVQYYQPDFREPAAIDASGGAQPLPLQLIIRRVGREEERDIPGREVRALVEALYAIYRPQFRASDLAHPLLDLARLPTDDEIVLLLPPTA